MTWKIPEIKYKKFKRNTITQVIVQLKYYHLLEIDNERNISEFQKKIRGNYPIYESKPINDIKIIEKELKTIRYTEFVFSNIAKTNRLTLNNQSISLTSFKHEDRQKFIDQFILLTSTFSEIFNPVNSIRLGLRYSNTIELSKINDYFNTQLKWDDIIKDDYLKIPFQLEKIENVRSLTEIRSNCRIGGMTIRYGMQESATASQFFLLDTDRYIESNNIKMDQIKQTLDNFATDIYQIFRTFADEKLINWMDEQKLQ